MTPNFPAIGEVACIAIEGADARLFAQAQFSGDMDALTPGRWQWNAWLSAQGRVQALMHLADLGDGGLLAVLRGGDAVAIHAALSRYVLRMKVSLTRRRLTALAGNATPLGAAFGEPDGVVILGYGERSLRLVACNRSPDPARRSRWRLHDIRMGWPMLPVGDHDFLPPALGLEHLGAVAFNKGCYPGQEIAARLHFRGGHKVRMHHLAGSQPLPPEPLRDADNRAISLLESTVIQDRVAALVVMPVTGSKTINILRNIYNIVSIFDA